MAKVPVLVISGMHRSASSVAAATLQAAGLAIGERLMGPFTGNPYGHFEDLDFVEIHQQALRALGLPEDGLIAEGAPLALPESSIRAAEVCIAARRAANRPWGFKDPRTTLFLNSWHVLLPEAYWLFLFRDPFLVLDSLRRRGDTIALESPNEALGSWVHYNSLILDFATQHWQQTLLCEIGTGETALPTLMAKISARFGLEPTNTLAVYEPTLLSKTGVIPPEVRPYLRAEATELYGQLRALALVP
jgi:hypothetical protein